MKILYVYPHPDDESFGPATVMSKQVRQGHEVYLLTLTKGGATKQRNKFGYSVAKMGEVRYKEMLNVSRVLGLKELVVLDLPDSELKEMDPREIEKVVKQEIVRIQPNVIVTYPVHGISGFHDHLITHAIVKRVFLEVKDKRWYLKRLAFTTLTEAISKKARQFKLNFSNENEIDCVVEVDKRDVEIATSALDCYKTYSDVIENTGIKKLINNNAYFELFQERFNPPLEDLFDQLPSER